CCPPIIGCRSSSFTTSWPAPMLRNWLERAEQPTSPRSRRGRDGVSHANRTVLRFGAARKVLEPGFGVLPGPTRTLRGLGVRLRSAVSPAAHGARPGCESAIRRPPRPASGAADRGVTDPKVLRRRNDDLLRGSGGGAAGLGG